MMDFIFGRLTLNDLPHNWYTIAGTVSMALICLVTALVIVKKKCWGHLWKEWLTSTDPTKIGTM